MKLTRKILSLLLMVSMVLSLALVGQATTFTDVPETHERYEAITELANRGIIAGYAAEDGTFNFQPDRIVTRAEMAKLLSEMFSITSSSTGVNIFTDIDDSWAKNYIIAAKDMGIINGYPDGTFLPDNQVSWQEAVKLIVCALNWGDAAVETYPNPAISDPENPAYAAYLADWAYSYKMMAQRLGLTQSALMIATEPAPRGIIAQLFFNALSIKKAVSDGKGGWSSDDNSSIEDESSYKTMRNVKIICTPTTNLETDTKTIKDGYVRLLDNDGNKYDMSVDGNTSIYNLIGRYADVSYEEKGKEHVIKSVKDLSKTTEIDLVKIKSVTENSIEYYTDDNFFKTAKIDFSKMDVIYNERPLADPSAFEELLNNAITFEVENDKALNYFGDVTVAKSNNHAMITIKAYKSYYMSKAVSSVNSETEGYKVSLDGREEPLVLHVKDDINNEILKKTALTDKGVVQTTVSIATKSIVTFSESDPDSIGNHYVEFFTTTAKKTGPVEEISSAKGKYKGKIKIGTSTFMVKNPDIWSKLENTSIGSNITYMTDPSGEIVYIESVSNGNEKFGFFMEYVSGDTDEHDSAVFKFYDPEAGTTFQVVISDPEDINDVLLSGKENGYLFWLRIKNNKVAAGDIINVDEDASKVVEKSEAEANEKLESIEIISGDSISRTSSGYKIDSENITVPSGLGKTFYNPDLNKSSVTYEKSTMTTDLKYEGKSKLYSIKRTSGTKAIVLHDKYKGLLTTSPVCVINESTGQGKVNDIDTRKYSYYNFKTGALSTNDLVIESSVASKLNLQKGDIITYYSDSETSGIHIDKLETVYILLRASEVSENRGAGIEEELKTKDMNADEGYVNGFRKYGISALNVIPGTYYNYSLSIPMWYDYDLNQLALARNSSTAKTYLPDDEALKTKLSGVFDDGGVWNKTTILENIDMTQVTVPTSVKLFVFDNDASEESRLISKTGATLDDIKAALSEMQTLEANNIESADEIKAAALECSLVYSYFSNTTSMQVVYIIK